MSFLFRHVQHLTRYFALLGLAVFALYYTGIAPKIILPLIGPVLYLAHTIKSAISSNIAALPDNEKVKMFGFLLPVTFVYYTLVGFQIKQLWNESGIARTLTLLTLLGFLVFIHFFAWHNLAAYTLPNA